MSLFKRTCLALLIFSLAFISYTCSSSGTGPGGGSGGNVTFDSKAAPGDSANSFLSDNQYTNLVLEIDYMEGFEPTQEGLNSLMSFLEERLNKSTISFNLTQIPARNAGPYSIDDIRSIEDEVRDNFTEANSNTLNVHFLIVDGESDQSGVIGFAYWNTSMAFFGQTIQNISGTPPAAPSRQQVEGTVFRHEFGHNIGLVGNGSPHPSGQQAHQTGQSKGAHCTTDGCLMEPSVETANFFNNFSGQVPSLQQLCIEDLQANGGQ